MSVDPPNESNFNEDEDDAWLYGENNQKQPKIDDPGILTEDRMSNHEDAGEVETENNFEAHLQPESFLKESDEQNTETAQEKTNEEADEDDDDDDDDEDDDGINIVISDISKTTSTVAPALNRAKQVTGTLVPLPTINQIQGAKPAAPVQTKGVEIDTPGHINGVPTYEYDIEGFKDEDKPWLQPGADITDYFNYGFTEETWIAYCLKQKRLRSENNMLKSSFQMMQTQNGVTAINGTTTNGSSLISINTSNSINQVISGSGQPPPGVVPNPNFSIHQQNSNLIQASQQINFQNKPPQFHPRFPPPGGQQPPQQFQPRMGPDQFNMPPPHMPDFSAPPPGWNPSGGPGPSGQPGMMPRIPQMPPQRMPNMPMGGQQQPPFNPSFQFGPPGMVPQPGMHDRPPGMPPHFYQGPFGRNSGPPHGQIISQNPQWDKSSGEGQHRPSRSPSPSRKSPLKSPGQQPQPDRYAKDTEKYKHREYPGRDYDKDHRRSPSPSRRHRRDHDRRGEYDRRDRDRSRERDRDRDRERDRDRDRGRSRDKSRDRSRDRSRSRDRDDKYKRSRHRSDDDEYRSSSKSHKRSKKSSRKDRDSNDREASNNPSQSQESTALDAKQD